MPHVSISAKPLIILLNLFEVSTENPINLLVRLNILIEIHLEWQTILEKL